MISRVPETAWLAAGLSVVQGGWMVFDGLRCLILGDYVRVNGQLGPWEAPLVARGIDPKSFAGVFVVAGIVWIACAVGLVVRRRHWWISAIVLSVITLPYCCIGTAVAALTLVCLLLPRTRAAFRDA